MFDKYVQIVSGDVEKKRDLIQKIREIMKHPVARESNDRRCVFSYHGISVDGVGISYSISDILNFLRQGGQNVVKNVTEYGGQFGQELEKAELHIYMTKASLEAFLSREEAACNKPAASVVAKPAQEANGASGKEEKEQEEQEEQKHLNSDTASDSSAWYSLDKALTATSSAQSSFNPNESRKAVIDFVTSKLTSGNATIYTPICQLFIDEMVNATQTDINNFSSKNIPQEMLSDLVLFKTGEEDYVTFDATLRQYFQDPKNCLQYIQWRYWEKRTTPVEFQFGQKAFIKVYALFRNAKIIVRDKRNNVTYQTKNQHTTQQIEIDYSAGRFTLQKRSSIHSSSSSNQSFFSESPPSSQGHGDDTSPSAPLANGWW